VLKKNTYSIILGISLFMIIIGIGISSMLTSCATTGAPQKSTVDLERQKQIDDSLRKVYEFELAKSWSLGFENYKGKLYADAIKHFWKVVEMDTIQKFTTVYRYLGDSYIKLDKPDSAEIVFKMGTQAYPDNPYYHRMLGWLLSGKYENKDAIAEYQMAIKLEPEAQADDYRALGNLLVQENRIDEAIPVYQKLVEMEPENAEAQGVLAQLLKSVGDEDAALETQEQALINDPENTKLMFSLGEAYFKRNDYQKSVVKFKMFLQRQPNDIFALEYLGNAQQNLGQYSQAIQTYEKALAVKPDHKKIYCEIATCYKELKNYVRARSVVKKAMDIDPNFGLSYIVLGEIYEAAADDCINSREKKRSTFDDTPIWPSAK
jgi:tetratricopeptide (TPR) repeat protein